LLWEEHERTGIPFTYLTNSISKRINAITDAVVSSNLPDNPRLRRRVVEQYVPRSLKELTGLEGILKKVPQNYLRWVIASRMATNFVYNNGLEIDEVAFHNYVSSLL
jgi:glutamate dehydrogenase